MLAQSTAVVLGVGLGLTALLAAASADDAPRPTGDRAALSLVRTDVMDRIFPDRPASPPTWREPVSVPRGASVAFQFALAAREGGRCDLRVSPVARGDGRRLEAETTVHEILPVPVEANNNGGSQTAPDRVPPESWLAEFVRRAPFDVAEVLVPAEAVQLTPGTTHAVLVDLRVASDAEPGVYTASLEVQGPAGRADAPFSLHVHGTVAPETPALHSHHWLFPEPEDLTTAERPDWWTERHWELIENSGRCLRAFGQDTILTPLIDYEQPLIQTLREGDGPYSFDYTRFDRWVEVFDRLGFRYFAGHHIAMLPEKWVYGGVSVLDPRTGRRTPLVAAGRGNEEWLAFLPVFYDSLYGHLRDQGLAERYLQHQLDEPKDGALYRRLAELTRAHLPGIRTLDAINSTPATFSPLVDIQVFALTILAKERALAAQRRAEGRSVWLYHCCSPYPPYPNRHLDERLTDSRLYPWLAYLLGAEGYLYWGANVYRGADPYRTSIGPLPNGSQNPGHPPGDNWMFYPGPDGLRGSLRMVAFRDGLLDHSLLTMLAPRDRAEADRIMATVARSISDYEKQPEAYHTARKALLEALERA